MRDLDSARTGLKYGKLNRIYPHESPKNQYFLLLQMTKPHKSDESLSLGLLAITCYPAIGSIICWVGQFDKSEVKRIAQLIVLLIGLWICWFNRKYWAASKITPWVINLYCLLLACFYIPLILSYANASIGIDPVVSGIIASAFFAHSVVVFAIRTNSRFNTMSATYKFKLFRADNYTSSRIIYWAIVFGWTLAILVWFKGSQQTDGSIHLAMNSMPVMLSMFFMGVFATLVWRNRILITLLSSPWIYLAICTTSRLTFVLLALLIFASIIDVLIKWKLSYPYKSQLYSQLVFAILFVCLISIPVIFPKSNFPYSNSTEQENTSLEWTFRFSRVLRIFPSFTGTIPISPLMSSEIQDAMNDSGGIADDRYTMLEESIDLILTHPLGIWSQPINLETTIDYPNSDVLTYEYSYPHNFFLECAIRYGWIPTATIIYGILISLIIAVRSIYCGRDLPDLIAGILFVFEFAKIQISGSIADSVGLLLLFTFLISRHFLRTSTLGFIRLSQIENSHL